MVHNSASNTSTVSAIAVIDLANELLERNCVSNDYLKSLGADFNACFQAWREKRTIQEARLPEPLLLQLWDEASRNSPDPHIGLAIGRKVNTQAKGVLANWLCQCRDLNEVFNTFSENIHLLNPSECWEKIALREHVKLRFRFRSFDYPSIAVDRSMAAIVSWSAVLLGQDVLPVSVSFTRPTPSSVDAYARLFGQHLAFSQDENTLVFDASLLHLPLKDANPYLKHLLSRQASVLSSTLQNDTSMTRRVNALLSEHLATYCQIHAVCDRLHVSRSTLYRKLRREGTSYTQLVRNARLSEVGRFGHADDNKYAMAERLGFSDTGSYYRFLRLNRV